MAKEQELLQLVAHTTDTPYGRLLTPDDIWLWHLGAFKTPKNTFIFMGVEISESILKTKNLILPSGKVVPANKTNGRGWKKPGYSDMINPDGKLINIVPYSFDNIVDPFEVTNGATGYNRNSRHVVLAGGHTPDGKNKTGYKSPGKLFEIEELYTPQAIETFVSYIRMQKQIIPHIKVTGHNKLAKKPCPNFDVELFCIKYGL
jgi:N-acetylmuramoyl-L-alanine amidase